MNILEKIELFLWANSVLGSRKKKEQPAVVRPYGDIPASWGPKLG
jgi:hypothetical protein